MIIFESLEIERFRNIKHARFEDLRDLNIIIGPNNCGKTNLLEVISRITELSCGVAYPYICEECQKFKAELAHTLNIKGIYLSLKTEDFYLRNTGQEMKLSFLLSQVEITRLVPRVLEKQRENLGFKDGSQMPCRSIKSEIVMRNEKGNSVLYGEHLSPFIHEDIIQEIKNALIYCPEGRLQSYKEKGFAEYVKERKLSGTQKRRWIDFLSRVIDPRIDDERYENLLIKLDGENFETEISKQGSGVSKCISRRN